MKLWLQEHYKGIGISILLAGLAYTLGTFVFKPINPILWAFILGIVIRNTQGLSESYTTGINFSSSQLLEGSILFLAFEVNYTHIFGLGTSTFMRLVGVLVVILITTYFLSRYLNMKGTTGYLIGFGTAVCGSSAIAALAPSISKDKDDVGVAMAVTNLLGSVFMILIPYGLQYFKLSDLENGLLIGGSLHSVANVTGAGFALSKSIGATALTIKLARVALLTPALIFFTYLIQRQEQKSWKSFFKLPWYLWGFIAITAFNSLVIVPSFLLEPIAFIGKLLLLISMVAIGLKVNLKQLLASGQKALGFGVLIFALQVLLIIGFMWLI